MAKKKTMVILVDDHPLFREGLKSVIAADPTFRVVAEAGDGTEALPFIDELAPDLVVTDLSMPGLDGMGLSLEIKKRAPQTRVMVVSMYADVSHLAAAFKAGADAYIVKESAAGRLLEAMARVMAGEKYIDPAMSSVLAEEMAGAGGSGGGYDLLTRREQQIMRLLVEGLEVAEIADRCFISPKTVENHRTRIMKKLGLKKEAQLVRYAARIGIIDLDLWR